jgi:protein-S-isoprenylcysteine O-methyltransferase Ste14
MFAGSILLAISLLLTSAGGRTLAKQGHQKEHETVWPDKFTEFGVLGCMRHPMHLGLALFPVAVALISGSLSAICSSGWGVAGALWFVLYIEEKDALGKYNTVYSDYMQRVPPFSLKADCIKKALQTW